MRTRKSRKSSKYTYQLFMLVDEGTLEELSKRNAMSESYMHHSCNKNITIYGKYRCAKKLKGGI